MEPSKQPGNADDLPDSTLDRSGANDHDITIRLRRETLVLTAALMFLGIAILLAVLFPPSSSSSVSSTQTSAAGSARVTDSSQPTKLASFPQATGTPSGAYPQPSAQPPAIQNKPAYPASQSQSGTATTQSGQSAATPLSLTPFDPERPSAGSFTTQQTSYPAPGATSDPLNEPDQPEPTDPPPPTDLPTQVPQPTARPQPTSAPQPTARPAATEGAGGAASDGEPEEPAPTKAPTAIPVNVLRGDIRWTAAQSPIIIQRDQQLAAGASLVIEPGVEVRLDPGVALFVDGAIYALGQPDRPVRIVNNQGQRWDGIYGRPGSTISMDHTEVRGGGTGGTVLVSEGGSLGLRNTRINDNGGHILVTDSRLEVRDSEIAGNDMPYGAALDATYNGGSNVTLVNNRIGGNRMATGAPPVQINNQSGDAVSLTIQRNLMIGQDGPDLVLTTNGPLIGDLTCNAWMNGANGLSIRSETLQVPGFALHIRDNATEDHTPPIIPIYLEFGIGRGATSEVAIDMRNNWWGSELGPYEPERYADGRGEAVGDNIEFQPWLTSRPACAPAP